MKAQEGGLAGLNFEGGRGNADFIITGQSIMMIRKARPIAKAKGRLLLPYRAETA